MMLKISACIPVYNVAPEYLEKLVDAVMAQDYPCFEIVIGDDCSNIDYRDLVARFSARRSVHYRRNERNVGMVANWNRTLAHATGDVAIVLGHDDLIAPGMFRAYADAFAESPEVVLVSAGSVMIGADGKRSGFQTNVNDRKNIFVYRDRYVLDGREVTRLCLRNGPAVGELSVQMFRLADFRAVGGYDSRFRHAADIDLAVRIAQRGKTVYLNRPYLYRRMHATNLTWQHLASGYVTADRAKLYEGNKTRYRFSSREIAQFRAYLVACACYDIVRLPRHKSVKVAASALAQIGRYGPAQPRAYRSAISEIWSGRNQDRR